MVPIWHGRCLEVQTIIQREVVMLNNAVRLLALISTLLACGTAGASVTVYTDRSAWEAAVTGSITTDNFNSFANGTAVTAATVFPSGITATGSALDISSFAFSAIGQGVALRTLFQNATITLPGSPIAFGFDYADIDQDGAGIAFGSFSQALANTGDADYGITDDDFAFFGVVASAADIPGGTFSFTVGTYEAFSIDNLSFVRSTAAIPEPGILGLLGLGLAGLGLVRRRRHF